MAIERRIRKALNIKQDNLEFHGNPSIGSMSDGQTAISKGSNGQLAIHRKKYGKLWKSYMSYNGDHYIDRNLNINGNTNIYGVRTEKNQPAFLAYNSADDDNFAIDSWVTVDFDTEVFDNGNNFSSDTFTAPVKGVYILSGQATIANLDSAATTHRIAIVTSNRSYYSYKDTDKYYNADLTGYHVIEARGHLCDMDAGDTATVQIYQGGGTQQADVKGHATAMLTYFSGYLLG